MAAVAVMAPINVGDSNGAGSKSAQSNPNTSSSANSNSNTSPSHICDLCSATFGRLEHLKRHVATLHPEHSADAKIHPCEHCAKRFSRHDVLLRHYQSCRLAKENGQRRPSTHQQQQQPQPQLPPSPGPSAQGPGNEHDDNIVVNRRRRATEGNGGASGGRAADEDAVSNGSDELPLYRDHQQRRAPRKRGRYVSNACVSCQKRKVKCSGEDVCQPCIAARLQCVYNTSRSRRKRRMTDQSRRSDHENAIAEDDYDRRAAPRPNMQQLMERIMRLERESHAFRQGYINGSQRDVMMDDDEEDEDYSDSESEDIAPIPHDEKQTFHAPSSILELMQSVNRMVDDLDHDLQQHQPHQPEHAPEHAAVTWHEMPRLDVTNLKTLESELRHGDVASLRESVTAFFNHLCPVFPVLNELEFRGQLEHFLQDREGMPQRQMTAESAHFAAALYLVLAIVKAATSDWRSDASVPGWDDFCRADIILTRLLWLSSGAIITVRCLALKSLYLYLIEKADPAYDVIGKAVRLLFQQGLHDQRLWIGIPHADIEARRILFWTIFCLERVISFQAGAPWMLHEVDINVDMPSTTTKAGEEFQAIDPALSIQDHSIAVYMYYWVKWCRLSAEVWTNMCSVNANKTDSEEFVAVMDAKLGHYTRQLPMELQWDRVRPSIHELGGPTPSQRAQSFTLYLLVNHIRLFIRREGILSPNYKDALAYDTLNIVAGTVDAVEAFRHNPSYGPTDRFTITLYLVSVLLALICIIVKSEGAPEIRTTAIATFGRALQVIEQLAPTYSAARHTLVRLQRLIGIVHRISSRIASPAPQQLQNETGPDANAQFALTPITNTSQQQHPPQMVPEMDKGAQQQHQQPSHQVWEDSEMTLLQQQLTAPGLLNFDPFEHSMTQNFIFEDNAAAMGLDFAEPQQQQQGVGKDTEMEFDIRL